MKINIANIESLTKKRYLGYMKLFPVMQQEKTKKYGIVILTMATIIFFAIFAINPTLTTIAQLHRKLSDAQLVHTSLLEKITNLGILQNKYSTILPAYNQIIASVPESPQATRFLGQIQTIAKNSGMQLRSLKTETFLLTPVSSQTTNFITFSATCNGNYEQIMNFLTTVTSFERIVTLDILSVNKSEILSKNIEISIQGSMYFAK